MSLPKYLRGKAESYHKRAFDYGFGLAEDAVHNAASRVYNWFTSGSNGGSSKLPKASKVAGTSRVSAPPHRISSLSSGMPKHARGFKRRAVSKKHRKHKRSVKRGRKRHVKRSKRAHVSKKTIQKVVWDTENPATTYSATQTVSVIPPTSASAAIFFFSNYRQFDISTARTTAYQSVSSDTVAGAAGTYISHYKSRIEISNQSDVTAVIRCWKLRARHEMVVDTVANLQSSGTNPNNWIYQQDTDELLETDQIGSTTLADTNTYKRPDWTPFMAPTMRRNYVIKPLGERQLAPGGTIRMFTTARALRLYDDLNGQRKANYLMRKGDYHYCFQVRGTPADLIADTTKVCYTMPKVNAIQFITLKAQAMPAAQGYLDVDNILNSVTNTYGIYGTAVAPSAVSGVNPEGAVPGATISA